jgi:hypothetical protein
MVGAAFGGGILLATMVSRLNNDSGGQRSRRQQRNLDHIKAALIGVAAMKVTTLSGEIVPGFQGTASMNPG